MCMSTPSIPEPEPMPAPPPAPPPQQQPEAPTPPPELVGADDKTTAIKKPTSKRSQMQQAAKGTSALKIPLNTGSGGGAKKSGGGLNIPT